MVRLRISIVEEKLGVGRMGIPKEHSSLLKVPRSCFVDVFGNVSIPGVNENDTSRLVSQWKVVVETRLQRDDAPII